MQNALSFVGPSYHFDNTAVAVSESINYYLEVAGEEGRQRTSLRGTPGLKSWSTGLHGAIRGLEAFDNVLYGVCGERFYTFDAFGVATSKGVIIGDWTAHMAYNSANQIVIADAPVGFMDGYFIFPGTVSRGYIYTIDTGTLTAISDADFDTAGERAFFISAINDGTNYDALDFATPESHPDKVVAVVTDHRQVLLFGTQTLEFWINTGGLTFPFERQRGAIVQRGAIAPASVVQANNTVYWLGDDRVVYELKGFSAMPISPAPVTEAIEGYGDVSDCQGFYHAWRGHKFLTLNFPSAGETWVFDATLPPAIAWHKRRSWNQSRWRVNDAAYVYGKTLAGDFSSGTVWEMDANTYTEGADILEAVRIGHYLHADNRRITVSMFELLMKAGVGVLSGEGETPKAALSVSKDLGQTYSREHTTDIGRLGEHNRHVRWRNVGSVRGSLSLKSRITAPVNRDIVGAVGHVKVGR